MADEASDTRERARDALHSLRDCCDIEGWNGYEAIVWDDGKALTILLDLLLSERTRAKEEQREVDARIAEGWDPPDEEIAQYSHGSHYIAGLGDAGERIAKVIRQGT